MKKESRLRLIQQPQNLQSIYENADLLQEKSVRLLKSSTELRQQSEAVRALAQRIVRKPILLH